jgi:hypothetical protein
VSLRLRNGSLPFNHSVQTLHTFLIWPICATCSTHLNVLVSTLLRMSGDGFRLWRPLSWALPSSSRYVLHLSRFSCCSQTPSVSTLCLVHETNCYAHTKRRRSHLQQFVARAPCCCFGGIPSLVEAAHPLQTGATGSCGWGNAFGKHPSLFLNICEK